MKKQKDLFISLFVIVKVQIVFKFKPCPVYSFSPQKKQTNNPASNSTCSFLLGTDIFSQTL